MKHHRVHNSVAVILVVFACLTIGLTAVATWVHQTVLVSDRFVNVVADVTSDARVIQRLSTGVADQLVTGISLESRLVNLLPDRLDRLAAPLTNAVEERIADATSEKLSSPSFQERWRTALTNLHAAFLRLLRGESELVAVKDGKLTIDVIAIADAAVTRLRDDGVLPAESVVPDLASTPTRQEALDRLSTALDARLPDDFGQVPIADASAIERMSALLGTFDVAVVGLAVLSLLLTAIAVWWANRRLASLASILIGTEVMIGILLLVFFVAQGAIADAIAGPEGRVVLGVFVDRLLQSLMAWLFVIGIVIGIVAIPVIAFSRRDQPTPSAPVAAEAS